MLDAFIERIVQAHAVGPLRMVLRGWEHDGRGGIVIFVNDDADKKSRAERLFLALGDGPWRIEWTPEPQSNTSQGRDDLASQSVYLEVAVRETADAEQVWGLVERLEAAVDQAALGELDGAWENGDALALAIYGEDADAMFACALPYLESLPLRPIHGERRYGRLDDEGARTEEFSLLDSHGPTVGRTG